MSDLESYEEDDSSVFDSSEEEEVQNVHNYELKNRWTIYDHVKSDSENYEANTRLVGNFDSAIDFWKYFNHYPKPSVLFNNGACKPTMGAKEISSISVFKEGIDPKWEDPMNQNGAEFSKRKFNKRSPLKELDADWFNLLMACVGEQIDSTITGIRVVDSSSLKREEYRQGGMDYRLAYRVELWFSDISRKESIEEQFKKLLNLDNPFYKDHKPRPPKSDDGSERQYNLGSNS